MTKASEKLLLPRALLCGVASVFLLCSPLPGQVIRTGGESIANISLCRTVAPDKSQEALDYFSAGRGSAESGRLDFRNYRPLNSRTYRPRPAVSSPASNPRRMADTCAGGGRVSGLSLDYRYWEVEDGVFIAAERGGRIRAFEYNLRNLTVTSSRAGNLPGGAASRLFDRISHRALCRTLLRDGSLSGSGDANLFFLSLRNDKGDTGRWFAHTGRTPRRVRLVVSALLGAARGAKEVPLAFSYLRSSRLSESDVTAAKASGSRFVSGQDFSPDSRALVADAVNRLGEFVPLTSSQATAILGRNQFLVSGDGSGYQLHVYKSKLPPPLPQKVP